jgi:hypothetical protein
MNANALYWKWCNEIGNYLGETTDEVHRRNKKRHLLPILEREGMQGIGDTMSAIRTLHNEGRQGYAKMFHSRLIDQATTTTLSTKLMSEYMEQVEREAVSLGINLPRPEDLAA